MIDNYGENNGCQASCHLGRHFINHYEKFSIHGCTTNVLTPPPQRSVRTGSGHVFGLGIESADIVTKWAAKIIKGGSDK